MRRDVFQAIADPVRRSIIDLLAKDTLTINEIAGHFDISRPAISKHIKILNECGVIEMQQKGRERYCHIQANSLIPAFLWIERYQKIWEERIDAFEEYVMYLQTKKENMEPFDAAKTATIQRTLKAPLKLVWEAWTQPEHLIRWWGPKGVKTKIEAHDFKVGGEWKYIMLMPNGNEFIAEGTYTDIVPMQKIASKADFKPMTEGVEMIALFEEVDHFTQFTFHVVHPTEAYKEQQEKMGLYNGWGSAFDRLEEFLEEASSAIS